MTRWANPLVWQWGVMSVTLCLLSVIASLTGLFWRTDLSLYDAALPRGTAPSDVVIVAIDDTSIAQLGRWPWRRSLHAALVERLRSMGARAVAFDLLLTEPDPDRPEDDLALANAMQRGPPTVLPLLVQMPGPGLALHELLPIPLLARAAAGIGHAHLELDRDGVVRSVFLREGIDTPRWPHFAVALLDAAPGSVPISLPGLRHTAAAPRREVWVRDHHMLIPFLGPPGFFPQISYVDVLRGVARDDEVRGKLVLVGATAQGIGDAYPTPRSGEGRNMPGVEITANVLAAVRSGADIHPLAAVASAAISIAVVVAAGLALLLMPPWQSLIAVTGIAMVSVAISVVGLRAGGWWWPPSSSLAALAAIYPLWSWRRLSVTQAFLEAEFRLLARERFPLMSPLSAPPASLPPVDFLEHRIDLLRQATDRLRSIRQLFSDAITCLPDATVLADPAGRIVLANPAAAALFGAADLGEVQATTVDAQLFKRVQMDALRFERLATSAPCSIEAFFSEARRHVLIRAVPFCARAGHRIGTLLALADITDLKTAQAEREDVMRFLSHDMKSPASSLLGLAQLQRDEQRALPPRELSLRLESVAQRLLTLVDGFVALARAGSADPRIFEPFDGGDAMSDAYDEVWASAHARSQSVNIETSDDALIIHGDRQLLARAIINLLSNALKFSAPGAMVDVTCRRVDSNIVIKVADHGPGIAPESATALFKPFSRKLHRGIPDPGGAGLGLAFVQVVADKHRGRVWVEDRVGYGAVFCLAIPTL